MRLSVPRGADHVVLLALLLGLLSSSRCVFRAVASEQRTTNGGDVDEGGVYQLVQCSYARVSPRSGRKRINESEIGRVCLREEKKAGKADRGWRVCVCLCVRMSYERLCCKLCAYFCDMCVYIYVCVCVCVCVRSVVGVSQMVKE